MQGTQAALDVFDGLAPVPVREVRGMWRGRTFPSGHPLDGVLEACGWLGKRIDDEEHVHPLVFRTVLGGRVHLRPWGARLALARGVSALRSPVLGRLAQLLLPLLATGRSQALVHSPAHESIRAGISASRCPGCRRSGSHRGAARRSTARGGSPRVRP